MSDAPPDRPNRPPPNDAKAERLAKALRDNLRRRKAPPSPKPSLPDDPAEA